MMLIVLVVMLAPASALSAATQAAKPGITVKVSPASQSIQQGKNATYTVTVTSSGGFAGKADLGVTGLPGGSTASFSPSSVALTSGASANSTLTVFTTGSTPAGSYTLKVTGTSLKTSASVTAGLTVNYQISGSFSLNASPASVTLAPGATAAYSIQLNRTNFPGPVNLAVMGGLPTGSVATFSPNPVTVASSTLQITTSTSAASGTYTLYLVGSGPDPAGKTQYAYASTQLVLDSTLKQFSLSGDPSGQLAPGTTLPLNLQISNPNTKTLSVTNISVSIASVTRTQQAKDRNLPCGLADYTVKQYSGPYPLTVQPGNPTSLKGLEIPDSMWPSIAMTDTNTNQDGCKGATLQLAYSGSGQGN
jgi:uncharacterized membrane protein